MPTITPPKKLKQSRTQTTVTFTAEETSKAEQKAVEKLGERIRIEGFRPGRAPADLLRQKIDPQALNEETVRELLPAVFESVLKEHKIQPIIPPKVDLTSNAPLTLVITFVEKPDVKVKGADGIRIPREEKSVELKDIDRMTEYLCKQYRKTEPVDRPAAHGDQVTIDFVGTADGKELEGTRASGYTLELGSKSFIPGFEDAIIGMKKGDKKDFALTFPSDYHADHLREKAVTFTATLHGVIAVTMPTLTDAFVKEHHLGESRADLEKRIRESLETERKRESTMKRERALFDAIRAATQIDLAPELLTHEERMIFDEIAENLEREKLSMQEWLERSKRTTEDLQKELKEEAAKRLTLRFAIQWLLQEKKIELTPADYAKAVDELLAGVPDEQRADAQKYYGEGGEGHDELQWRKRVEKLVEMMLAR